MRSVYFIQCFPYCLSNSFIMDDKEYLKKIGANIVSIRQEKNMSQVELANSMDMEDSSLRRIEKGRVNSTILMLRKIAKGLGISIDKILPN